MSTQMMKAIRVHQYGGTNQLQLEQVQCPKPLAREVLVRVHAAAVLPYDCKVRSGIMKGFIPMEFPYIPSTAFAGVIEEVGPDVIEFHRGQAIFGQAPNGTSAEFTTASIDSIAHKPENISYDEAASVLGGATTAWESLFLNGGLRAGDRILIHGAAGGVGLFAVQFAKWKGAEVIATASAGNLDFVRSLGADTVIDYTVTAFDEVVKDVDYVLDTIGGKTLERSLYAVKPGGTLVTIAGEPSVEKANQLGINALRVSCRCTGEDLQAIAQLLGQGKIKAVIRKTFPLHEARSAHELCQTGHGRGRIVLHIGNE